MQDLYNLFTVINFFFKLVQELRRVDNRVDLKCLNMECSAVASTLDKSY